MIETAALLLLAHLLGDYVFQTKWMIDQKRAGPDMGAHIVVHAGLLALALGQDWAFVAGLVLAHLVTDLVKTHLLPDRLSVYLADQGAHLAALGAALWLGAETRWALPPQALEAAMLLCGLITATLAGGPVIGYLMAPYQDAGTPDGLPQAGRMIGLLERALIVMMVLVGQPAGIGFLIAAKSILRFDTASKDQRASEYVIIGTLASFGWALGVAYVTQFATVQLLP